MKKIYYILLLIFVLAACDDIINSDQDYKKELLIKKEQAADSLMYLNISLQDLGMVKFGSVSSAYLNVYNGSEKTIEIYEVKNSDKTGVFTYQFPKGMPFEIQPDEHTINTGKIKVRFIADSFTKGIYRDTLYLNGVQDIYIPLKANVFY